MDADNKMERIVASLDFNSRKGTWFDMWHTHLDWEGKGNESFEIRRKYLLEAIKSYDTFWSKMENHPRPYQAWILIDLTDSSEDAVYIHSPDPAGDSPFPFSIGLKQQSPKPEDELCRLFTEKGFVFFVHPEQEDIYFFARPGAGVPLS
jgi:hypothetical protein